jgi:hypothetical protein
MSKGMWCKQFTSDGEVFYYNATINKSLWKPPQDGIVFEAENLKRRRSNSVDYEAPAQDSASVHLEGPQNDNNKYQEPNSNHNGPISNSDSNNKKKTSIVNT